MPRISFPHPLSGVSTNDATTRHNVVSAPTETSKARTISALVCPMAASANGIVATNRLFNVKLDRKAGLRLLVYPPRTMISMIIAAMGAHRLRCKRSRRLLVFTAHSDSLMLGR